MLRSESEKGEGRLGSIIWLLIVAGVLYAGWNLIPAYFSNYNFADKMTEPPEFAREVVSPYMELAGLLGRRTAQLHRALASNSDDEAFAPEPFTMEFQRKMAESRLELTEKMLSLLRGKILSLPAGLQPLASELAGRQHEIAGRFQAMLAKPAKSCLVAESESKAKGAANSK